MVFKKGDKVYANSKTYMGSFNSLLNDKGMLVGLQNILPVTGIVFEVCDNYINIKLDEKCREYFNFLIITMSKSDLYMFNFIMKLEDEDFMI